MSESSRFLIEAGCQAPCADNSQPWHFTVGNRMLTLGFDQARCGTNGFGPASHATLLAMGAAIENILQAANAAELDMRWEIATGNFPESGYFQGEFDQSAAIPAKARQHSIFSRQTNRAPYISKPLPEALEAHIGSMNESSARVQLITAPDEIAEVGRLTELASRARFQTQEIHEWLGAALRFTREEAQSGDGLDVATLELPPGGKTLLKILKDWKRLDYLNRFGAYKLLAGIEAVLIKKAPLLLIITGKEGSAEAMSAGRLMERVWLMLAENGIAAHPYYVIPDQLHRLRQGSVPHHLTDSVNQLGESVVSLLGSSDVLPHMVLRVGYPKRPAARSLRLPLEAVYTEIQE